MRDARHLTRRTCLWLPGMIGLERALAAQSTIDEEIRKLPVDAARAFLRKAAGDSSASRPRQFRSRFGGGDPYRAGARERDCRTPLRLRRATGAARVRSGGALLHSVRPAPASRQGKQPRGRLCDHVHPHAAFREAADCREPAGRAVEHRTARAAAKRGRGAARLCRALLRRANDDADVGTQSEDPGRGHLGCAEAARAVRRSFPTCSPTETCRRSLP